MQMKCGGSTAAQRLTLFKDEIFEKWESRSSEDRRVRDVIPPFLETLARVLRGGSPYAGSWNEIHDILRNHTRRPEVQRECSLPQTLRELGALRIMVLETLESEETLTRLEKETVLLAFEEGMIGAAEGYERGAPEVPHGLGVHAHQGEAESSLQKEKQVEQFRLLAESMPLIVWVADAAGALVYINQRFLEYTGIPQELGLGQAWRWTIHPDDFPRIEQIWYRSMTTGEPYSSEYRLIDRNREYRWHRGQGVPVRDEQGRILRWYGNSTDVHDYRVSHDLLVKERDLRERFVATMTHDLRTPLSAARMHTQLLVRKSQDPEQVQNLGSRVIGNIDRADRMIQDMLDASRLRAGEKLPIEFNRCSLREVIGTAILDLSSVHGDRFVLRSEEPFEGDWGCDAIRRIVENLCSNAIKYGTSGGNVTVTLRRTDHERLLISVHNLGPAIPSEDQMNLFEQFHRSSSAQAGRQKGWGLGLTIVRGLTEAHEGRVSIESVEGKGTTFTVELPLEQRNCGGTFRNDVD